MGNSGIALKMDRAANAWIFETAFVGLLLLVFVGVTPFAVRNSANVTVGAGEAAGSGDMLRQLLYFAVFVATLFGAYVKRGRTFLDSIPILLAVLLAWCVVTAVLSGEPGIAIRRAGLETILVVSVMLGVDNVGAERALKLLCYVLIGVLVVNWISIPLLSQAIHQPGDVETEVVGDWRGLYFHKNIAGGACAISILLFIYCAIAEKRPLLYGALATAAAGFLWMTHSKSSLGLLPVAVASGGIYWLGWRRGIDRAITGVSALLIVFVLGALLFIYLGAVEQALSDPSQFTGRSAIWQGELAFITDHPFFGAGFGTFADAGKLSPLHPYVGGWVNKAAQGHNGYLEVAMTTGLIGLALAIFVFIAQPAWSFWRRGDMEPLFKALLFALFVFCVLHNFMESDFLAGDGLVWTALLLTLAMLRNAREQARI